MKILNIFESLINCFDFGFVIETVRNSMKHKFDIDFVEVFKRLIWGGGYDELTPPQLSKKLQNGNSNPLIVDLREKERFEKSHIEEAISSPFDDFLRDVLVEEKYSDSLEKEIVLVCDTGHMSRVAGSVLAEEGFEKVYSLKRGMRRWLRWQNLLTYSHSLNNEKNWYVAGCCISK